MTTAVRRIARPMLASIFVYGGLDALRNPASKVPAAEDVAEPLADALSIDVPGGTEQLVKINGAVQVGAGLLLATGKLPRLAALALLGSLAPTTAAGHRFWEAEDDRSRALHRTHFLKNVSMGGGLLLAALDTEGRPSVAWRAKRAARKATERTEAAVARGHRKAEKARRTAEKRAAGRRKDATAVTKRAGRRAA